MKDVYQKLLVKTLRKSGICYSIAKKIVFGDFFTVYRKSYLNIISNGKAIVVETPGIDKFLHHFKQKKDYNQLDLVLCVKKSTYYSTFLFEETSCSKNRKSFSSLLANGKTIGSGNGQFICYITNITKEHQLEKLQDNNIFLRDQLNDFTNNKNHEFKILVGKLALFCSNSPHCSHLHNGFFILKFKHSMSLLKAPLIAEKRPRCSQCGKPFFSSSNFFKEFYTENC